MWFFRSFQITSYPSVLENWPRKTFFGGRGEGPNWSIKPDKTGFRNWNIVFSLLRSHFLNKNFKFNDPTYRLSAWLKNLGENSNNDSQEKSNGQKKIYLSYYQMDRQFNGGHCGLTARASDWELETGVQSPGWAKSLTPGFALMNHFQKMIISVRIDFCAETWFIIKCLLIFDSH